jgi:ribosome maturation factor RimP
MSRSEDALVRALSPFCDELGVRLYDVELAPALVRVTVESDEGVDLESLSDLARRISAFLDDNAGLAPEGRYELEVGTPGLERRLRTPAQLAGAVGERVALRLRNGVAAPRRLEGMLVSAESGRLSLALDDGSAAEVAFDDLERARTVFDWQQAFAQDKRARRRGGGVDGDTKRKVAKP